MKCIWLVVKNGQLRKKEKKGKKKEGRDAMSIKINLDLTGTEILSTIQGLIMNRRVEG
jgi:hypothetical protein